MAEKEITLKIQADVDDSQVQDLESLLQQIVDGKITIPVEADPEGQLEEVESRIDELEQVRADIYMGVSDEELDEVEAELAELESKQIELTAQIEAQGLEETTQGMQELEQQTDATSSALEAMAMIDIAGALSQWGSQAESFAQELDNVAISTEQLAIQTGMTDAEMTGMLNNITNATFPRDEALMYVQSLDQIGVSAQNLGASATGLDRINDAFHMGAPAVNKLGQELSVLGVDMNNVSSSFNALAYANANTVGGMENFSKFLTRFDSQFNELGLNVDQAAVAIAGATHKFGGGRAALTGMSEALKNCNGDLSLLEQELGLEAGALSNASQLTGQYAGQLDAMADKEAQHKTLTQQIAAALDDVTASVNGAISPFASFIGMVGNAGSFAVGINGLIQLGNTIRGLDVVSTIAGKLGTLKTAIIDVGTAAWNGITAVASLGKEILIAGANAVKAAAMWVVEKVQLIASTVAKYAAAAASMALGVAEWFAASPILLVAAVIIALIAVLWYLYSTNEEVRVAIDGFAQALWGLGEAIYGSIQGAIQWLIDSLTWLWETITGLFTGTSTEGTSWLTTMIMVLMGPIGWIMLLIQNFNTLAPAISTALAGMYQAAVNWFNQTGQRISSFASSIVSQLSSAASSAVSGFMSHISSLPGRVAGELNAILQHAIQWGQNLINTLVSAAQNAVSGILGAFQINSPGIIQRKLVTEFENTNQRVDSITTSMATMMGENSQDMVRSWGNPSFDYSFQGSMSNLENMGSKSNIDNAGNGQPPVTYNLNFNLYGDMDNEERMQKFLNYVIEYMDWDNSTAGRNMDVL
jgi:hypothetical protein